jgi:hypothetical protein
VININKRVVKYLVGVIVVRASSTNSVEDRGQRERGYGSGSPLVRGFAQFANE